MTALENLSKNGSDTPLLAGVEADIRQHLYGSDETWSSNVRSRREHLLRFGYVKVSDLLPGGVKTKLQAEGLAIAEQAARRIDIQIKETGDSPRRLGSVNVRDICEMGELIPCLYHSPAMRSALDDLTGAPVIDCDWENERLTMTRQEAVGDTHGWHWGDYQYALIFILAHPPIDHGGMLQCIPHTVWDKDQPDINRLLTENPIHTYFHQAGDIYFFRTDTTLHRTYPLDKPGVRVILNFTYDGPAGEGKVRSHETQHAVYDW